MADNCLLTQETRLGIVIVCVYIDDTLCIRNKEALDGFKSEIKHFFKVKEEGTMAKYVGCSVTRVGPKMYMHQKEPIMPMEKAFELDLGKGDRKYETPGAPGVGITKLAEGETKLGQETQTKYRSGVGIILFLVKYSRPDIANSVRNLRKVNDGAGERHYIELIGCLKYVFGMREKALVFLPVMRTAEDIQWSLEGYCDSDFTRDKDRRISVTGFCVYVCGCLVSWKSCRQKHVTLSTTEAE